MNNGWNVRMRIINSPRTESLVLSRVPTPGERIEHEGCIWIVDRVVHKHLLAPEPVIAADVYVRAF